MCVCVCVCAVIHVCDAGSGMVCRQRVHQWKDYEENRINTNRPQERNEQQSTRAAPPDQQSFRNISLHPIWAVPLGQSTVWAVPLGQSTVCYQCIYVCVSLERGELDGLFALGKIRLGRHVL